MKITISGLPGSGKTTVTKLLAKKLKLKHYSIGNLMRKIAKKKNINELELNKIAEKQKDIDKKLDDFQKKLANKDNFVLDSRIGFYFIPDSIKIFLKVNLKQGAKRIFKDKRKEESYKTIKQTLKAIKRRMKSETIRYKKHYGIKNFRSKKNYDLVIDTTNLKPDEVVNKIIRFIKNH